MKLHRVSAIVAALLTVAVGASAQTQTVATGRVAKADVGFGVEFQLSSTSGEVRRFGYPRVASVKPTSSAARAGLTVGDVLIAVDGRDTRQPGNWWADLAPGRRYTLRVRRGEEERNMEIEAGPPPARK